MKVHVPGHWLQTVMHTLVCTDDCPEERLGSLLLMGKLRLSLVAGRVSKQPARACNSPQDSGLASPQLRVTRLPWTGPKRTPGANLRAPSLPDTGFFPPFL